jgi:rhodanese-related sulfurtransferase
MQQIPLVSKHRLRLACLAAILGMTLAGAQIGSSAPLPVMPQSLAAQLESAQAPLILDVRSPEEFVAGHIPGAVNIPYRQVPARLDELATDQDRAIVVYCEVGIRAGIAQVALEQAGFQQIHLLEGHMQAWRQEKLPIESALPVSTP